MAVFNGRPSEPKGDRGQVVQVKAISEALYHWAVALQRWCFRHWLLAQSTSIVNASLVHGWQLKLFQRVLHSWSAAVAIRQWHLRSILHAATALQSYSFNVWAQRWLLTKAEAKKAALQAEVKKAVLQALRQHVELCRRRIATLEASRTTRSLSTILCLWYRSMSEANEAISIASKLLRHSKNQRKLQQGLCTWHRLPEARSHRLAELATLLKRVALRRAFHRWHRAAQMFIGQTWVLRAWHFNCHCLMQRAVRGWMLWFIFRRGNIVKANCLRSRLAQLQAPKAIRRWHCAAQTKRKLRTAHSVLVWSHIQRVLLPLLIAWGRHAHWRRSKRVRQDKARTLYTAAMQRQAVKEAIAIADRQLRGRAAEAAAARKRRALEALPCFKHWLIFVHSQCVAREAAHCAGRTGQHLESNVYN